MTCTLRQIVIVSGGLCFVKVDVSPREVLVELVQCFVVAALFGLLDTFEIQRYAFFIILKHRIHITYVLVQHGKVWFLLIGIAHLHALDIKIKRIGIVASLKIDVTRLDMSKGAG